MTVTITAFESSPDRGRGLARDMRVRWALEEVGQPYEVRLASFAAMKAPAHVALHPFGQIPLGGQAFAGPEDAAQDQKLDLPSDRGGEFFRLDLLKRHVACSLRGQIL